MTDFKVGDRVRLTGSLWGKYDTPTKGWVVEVSSIDASGLPWFVAEGEGRFIEEGGWDAELVTDAPTYADVEDVAALATQLGIPATRVDDFTRTVGMLDPISPDHYQFPGGVRVHQISAHLTSCGGQAVQYIARSTRLDGRNKGDQIENLKKAQKMIAWEIERLETK